MAEGTTPLTAYLQLVPKIKSDGLDSEITPALEKSGTKAGTGFGKKFLAAFAALGIGAAMWDLIKKSYTAYADYEQLTGGAVLLWGDAYNEVAGYASNAYKTLQMSQSDYLEQANAFAIAFQEGLNGDAHAAAQLADRMLRTQADLVAAMGISQESAQRAIEGVLRGNYTMIDNLRLGIKPTQEGYAEMMDTVNAWHEANGRATHYVMGNYADMEAALADYVEMQGLAGYATMEAGTTIQGATAGMRASWANLLVALADDTQDLSVYVSAFVEQLVSLGQLALPRVIQIVHGIFEALPSVIEELMPALMDFLLQLVSELPGIVQAGMECITRLIEGLSDAMPELMQTIVDVIVQIAQTLTKPENLVPLLHAALVLINELARGLVLAIPSLIEAVPSLIESLGASVESFVPEMLQMGVQLVAGIAAGIVNAGWKVGQALLDVAKAGWNKAKSWLGIQSPSKRFAEMGEMITAGLGEGIANRSRDAVDSMMGVIGNLETAAAAGMNAINSASVTINASVNASSLADVETVSQLVSRMMDARTAQQNRVIRMGGAAYGY